MSTFETGRFRFALVFGASLLYALAFIPLYRMFDLSVAILGVIPVIFAGALYGARVGGVAGVLGIVGSDLLFTAAGAGSTALYVQAILGVIGFVAIGVVAGRMRDLSLEVRQAAGALELERARLQKELSAREEYTSVVVHELRNPLIAMSAATRVLARDAANAHAAPTLTAVAAEAGRALDLLDGLNDASSVEAGRLRSVLRPIDLNVVVRGIVDATEALGRDVSLRVSDTPIVVLADERRLGQVLRNLIGNAAKYSPADTPIEVTVGLASNRQSAIVRVRDYGPGVPPPERERLFQKFARLSTAGGTSGSGLGLYISRGIIRDHGGDLVAEWPAGGGTAMTLTLRLAQA